MITKPEEEEVSQCIQTPMAIHAVRILRANERLAAERSIDQHIIRGFTISLREEKKRRQRGKRLNLLGVEDSGPQFFSPSKVQAARDRQAVKEDEKLQKQQEIEERKALATAARHQKEK